MMTGAAFLLTLAVTSASPEATTSTTFQARLVLTGGRIEAADGGPESVLERRSQGDLREVWYWSDSTPPRKVVASQLNAGQLAAAFDDAATFDDQPSQNHRLQVHIARPSDTSNARVADEETGSANPFIGARVVAAPVAMWQEIPEGLLPSWPVDPNGRVWLPRNPEESWRLRVVQADRGSWWAEVHSRQTKVTLTVASAADLRLDVVDSAGEPIAEATLQVREASPQRAVQGLLLARYRAAQGTVTIPALPPNADLAVMLTAPEHLAASLIGRPDTFPKRVRLDAGVAVSGRFVDPDGQAVANVDVTLETWASDEFPLTVRMQSTSDEHGHWRIAPIPARQVALRASAAGFATRNARPLVGPEGLDLGEVVLQPASKLHLLVRDENGEPVHEAEVRTIEGESTMTDAAGRAELQSISARDHVELSVDAHGFLPTEVRLAAPHPALAEVSLRRALLITGRLLDADQIPVSGGVARLSRTRLSREQRQHSELLGSRGNFELELAAHTAFELTLTSPTTRQLHLTIEPGEPGEVRDLGDLIAPGGLSVQATLISAADGSPVAAARVWAPRASAGDPLTAWVHGDLLETRSSADGVFLLAGLDPAPTRIRVDAPGFARRELDLPPEATDGSSSGHTIVDLGTVELDGGVTLRVVTEPTSEGVARVDLGNRWLEVEMLTAPLSDGQATFPHVTPGQMTITVLHRESLVCEEAVAVSGDEEEIEVLCRAVSLRVAGDVRLGGYPAGPGRLLWLPPTTDNPSFIMTEVSSTGLEQDRLYGAGRSQVDVDVDASGHFITERLRPGQWDVIWLSKDGGTSPVRRVELPEVDDLEINLDFPGRRLEGVVHDLESRPVEGARVRELGTGSIAFTDVAGRFHLSGLEPGVHYLKADAGGLTSPPLEVNLPPDREPTPVQLVIGDEEPRGVLVQVIDDGTGGSVAGAVVFFEAEGRLQQILTADAKGVLEVRLDPPFPSRVRLAAFAGGRWALGDWKNWDAALREEGIVLHVGTTGWLRLSNPTGTALTPRIMSAQGWDLSWLLTRLGLRPVVAPGQTLDLAGIPEATYSISTDVSTADASTSIAIERDRPTAFELGGVP